MKYTKFIVSTIILLALVFDIGGQLALFLKLRRDVQKKVKRLILQNIPQSELEVFSSEIGKSIKGAVWVHSGEFRFNDEMYDVVKRDTSQQTITYYCVCDKDETRIIKQYSKLVSVKLNDLSINFSKIPIFIIELYFVRNFAMIIDNYYVYNYFRDKSNTLFGYVQNSNPPPKLII